METKPNNETEAAHPVGSSGLVGIECLVNGLRHMQDDHPCCRGTIELSISALIRADRIEYAMREVLDWAPSPPEHWRDEERRAFVRAFDAARDAMRPTVKVSHRANDDHATT